MKIGSLFDGSGGFPLAATLCGMEPVWASEVEPYAIAVTRSRFPNMVHLGDVSKIDGSKTPPVHTITFGSPCQDMSIAGKREGIKHTANGDDETTRSGLFMEAVRIIREMRQATNGVCPRFAVWENVFGAFSSNRGEDFRLVLQSLIEIVEPTAVVPAVPKGGWAYADCWVGDGWSIGWRTFDAQYWGVPQRRRRIYLVADFGGECAGKVLFERDCLQGCFAEGGAPWQRAAADAPGGAGICDSESKLIAFHLLQDPISDADKSPCITQGSISGQASIGIAISAGFKAGQSSQARSVGYELEKSPTLASEAGGNSVPSVCVAFTQNQRDELRDLNGVAGTLVAEPGMKQQTYIAIPINDKATRWRGGGKTRKGDGSGNGLGVGNPGDPAPTITAGDRHAVAYRMRGFGDYVEDETASAIKQRDYKDCTDVVVNGLDCRNGKLNGDLCGTLQAKPNGGYSHNCTHPVLIKNAQFFIVRRLTPTECTRLQGFLDHWGEVTPLDINNPAELAFWREVYRLDCQIKGKKISASIMTKPERLAKWHDNLHSDASEYKLWGNGIALPCALYVMQGIEEVLHDA